jgi:hypothetical protein
MNQWNCVYVIGAIIIFIFIIWLFLGNNNKYEFVGVTPLLTIPDLNQSSVRQKKEMISSICMSGKFEKQMSYVQLTEVNRLQREREELLEADEQTLKKIKKKPFISNGELKCKEIIEKIYGQPFKKVRPEWLKNEATGRNLELDLYNDNIVIDGNRFALAVEYMGVQHYLMPNGFHKTITEFRDSIRRDILKYDLCNLNEVYLITVPYYVEEKNMEEYIMRMIPDVLIPEKYRSK